MSKSKVYFTNLRTGFNNSLLNKLARVINRAGIENIDMNGKFVAIKMHFGEPGNLAFLRPNWAKVVADQVKKQGGKPFLTDCNTLYVGGRKNAIDHLQSAEENGFSPLSTGCQMIIADGLKGLDETDVPVDGKYIKVAHIGQALMDADVVISLAHFKGHEATGFGGALKNIGMGGGSRAGKMAMHSDGKPQVNQDLCIHCGMCAKICAHGAPDLSGKKCHINHDICVGCGRCIAICPKDAIEPTSSSSNDLLNAKMMEYAKAIVQNRPAFYINIAVDISPNCDCHDENDAPITPNIGIFASTDPVALDTASADAVNKAPVCPNSMLDDSDQHTADHFNDTHPDTNWRSGMEYAASIGLGSTDYELIVVK